MNKLKVSFKILLFVILIITVLTNNVLAATLTLMQIADKMKTSNPMAEHMMDNYNATITAEVENDKIIIEEVNSSLVDEQTLHVEFVLQGNILSTNIEKNTQGSSIVYMSKLSLAWMLIDCIGQLNGYEKEEFYKTIKGTGENYKNYKIDKEGLEINTVNNITEIKIDLSKKVPIVEIEDSTEDESDGGIELIHIDSSTNTYNVKYTNTTNQNNTINQNNTTNQNNTNVVNDSNLPKTGVISIIPIISCIIIVAGICYIKYEKIDS